MHESGVACPAGHRIMISYYDKHKSTLRYYFKKIIVASVTLQNGADIEPKQGEMKRLHGLE